MRVTRTVVLTAAVVALAAITGCSKSGGARGSPRDIPQPSVVCEEGQTPSDGVCADTVPPEPQKVKIGEPFMFQEVATDPTSLVWSVKVTAIKCGLTVIRGGIHNYAWDGDPAHPDSLDAHPAAGQQFCQATALLVNRSQVPSANPPTFGNVVTDKGSFAATSDTTEIASRVMDQLGRPTVNDLQPVNPGATTTLIGVWSLPANAKPSAVTFPDTFDNAPTNLIAA